MVNSVLESFLLGVFTHTHFIKEHQPQFFFFVIFAGTALKLKKVGTNSSSLSPCPSLPSVAIEDRKQLKWLIKSRIRKLDHYFSTSIAAKKI